LSLALGVVAFVLKLLMSSRVCAKRNRDEKLFYRISDLSFFQSDFEVLQIALIARATFPLVHLARTCRPVTAAALADN
jgi:uncharacterized membrane protein